MPVRDKSTTDGLLASRIGAGFIRVKHFRSPRDPLRVRLAYLLDDLRSIFPARTPAV